MIRQLHEANRNISRLTEQVRDAQQSASVYANQVAFEQRANAALTRQVGTLQVQVEQWKSVARKEQQQAERAVAALNEEKRKDAEAGTWKQEVNRLTAALDRAWAEIARLQRGEPAPPAPEPAPRPKEIKFQRGQHFAFILWDGAGTYAARKGLRKPLQFHRIAGVAPDGCIVEEFAHEPAAMAP